MAEETYISFKEYLDSQPGAVLLFILRDFRGAEFARQVVLANDVIILETGRLKANFIVDERLSARMVPGNYTLYIYVGLPKLATSTSPSDYEPEKCLTEQGIKIRVRGGLDEPAVTSVLSGENV